MEHKGAAPHALYLAVQEGHVDVVADLLGQIPPSSLVDALDAVEALHFAARAGHVKIVKMLIAHTPTLAAAKDRNGRTALHVAVEHDEVVSLLLAHNPELIDEKGHFDVNILHAAVQVGCERVVARLLAVKPSLADAIVSLNGETALFLAAFHGHDGVVAQLLAHSPELVDVKTSNSQTVLHAAALSGRVEVVARLLAHKPKLIEALDFYNQTPLHCAAQRAHAEVVAQLFAARPSLANATDLYNSTALFAAAERVHTSIGFSIPGTLVTAGRKGTLLERARAVEFLLPHTAEAAHRCDNAGNTLLHLVAENIPTLAEKVLRMNPEALYVANNKSHTPFTLALRSKNWAAVELFRSKLALDDIFDAFTKHCVIWGQTHHQLGSVMKQQYQAVWASLLPRDLVDTVYEYLGFERQTQTRKDNVKKTTPHTTRRRLQVSKQASEVQQAVKNTTTGASMQARAEVRRVDSYGDNLDHPRGPLMQTTVNEAAVSPHHHPPHIAGRHGQGARRRPPRGLTRGLHNKAQGGRADHAHQSQARGFSLNEQAHTGLVFRFRTAASSHAAPHAGPCV